MNLPIFPPEPILARAPRAGWQRRVAPFRGGDTRRSVVQLVTSFAAFFAAWGVAFAALAVSPWLALAADLVVAGVLIRLFIIQHDCGHGSFLQSERWSAVVGQLPGFLLLTPFLPWRTDHAVHHATTGDLGKRGVGDIATWTVAEYRAASRWRRVGYRLVRNPFVMLVGGPVWVFLIGHRFPGFFSRAPTRADRLSVHLTTVVGLGAWAGIVAAFGWDALLFVHLPSLLLATAAGIFLFYVQHQFPEPYWSEGAAWSYADACLDGSSHLALGPVLGWFTGDIGVHHIHHLAPKIPNYRLRECLAAHPQLAATTTLGLWDAVKTLRLKLYDEETGRMVTFAAAREPRV